MVSLSISNRDWNVLSRLLHNSGLNYFNVNKIISEHKKILNDFKEKLEYKKAVELEKFKRELDKNIVKNREDKILKFQNQREEELQEKFKNEFYKIAQKIEGKY